MTKVKRSFIAALLMTAAVATLTGVTSRAALALEPERASDIVALVATVPHLVPEEDSLACPYRLDGGAFAEVGPDGSSSTPFVTPSGTVFIATAFEWHGTGGVQESLEFPLVWERNVLAQATVLQPGNPGGSSGRVRIRSTAIADADDGTVNQQFQVQAGNAMTMPTGVVLRAEEGEPLCLFIQQLNDPAQAGSAFLYGFLARDS